MAKRIIVGICLGGAICALIWLHGWYLAVSMVVLSIAMEYEIIRAMRNGGVRVIKPVLYGFAALLLPAYLDGGFASVFIVQMICVSLIFLSGIIFKYEFESIFSSIFILYYPTLFFVFLYAIIFIGDLELSRLMLLVAIGCAVGTDVFAYFTGTFLGKTPLCPRISPKKTVEGAVGGLCGGILFVEVIALLFDNGRVHLIEYAVLAVVLSLMAQIGDLSASVVKRRYGIKDFGSILPGHGGIFDRSDSTLFVLPIVYMFFKMYLQV